MSRTLFAHSPDGNLEVDPEFARTYEQVVARLTENAVVGSGAPLDGDVPLAGGGTIRFSDVRVWEEADSFL